MKLLFVFVLYLELWLRAQTTQNDGFQVQKAVNPQERWRQRDLIGGCPARETLSQTQIVKAGHFLMQPLAID